MGAVAPRWFGLKIRLSKLLVSWNLAGLAVLYATGSAVRALKIFMKLSRKSLLAVGIVALGAAAYPVANSLAVPAAPAHLATTTISCPMGEATAIKMAEGKAEIPSISQVALTKAIADKSVTVFDVNGSDSYKAGHIPSAVDFSTIKDFKAALPADKNALVVAYCGNEYCGAYKQAADAAIKLGYTNVQHFSPGIAGWKASGAAIEKA